ncbi:nuclear transport factor 2 family protein [Massilia dura]|uniref:Nuclear transport factor 2 family protein n=1 Tax=Pseudoduganella dura TaxID=321982 RepID=A0A6I3XHD7_9BURK|nr:nuclear transport factor 2 family protein [Pseudoduganella dura]MUI15839.1 nuclear transport factor 2 family protein [Pseudoduganella dura]GGX89748.1 membrane protein [Pseudoduganella dura]
MQDAPIQVIADTNCARDAANLVDTYLRTLMIPDPDGARRFISPQLRIRFTGGRHMRDPAECAAFNAGRYAWVQKRFERIEVVGGATAEEAIVYSLGTLHGAWPDGSAFEGNRYVDRYVVRHGLIAEMQVWNDSAELLLTRLERDAGAGGETGSEAGT